MNVKSQSAIRGVFSVGAINVLARFFSYGKHVLITAYIGLSAELDAFYMALAVVTLIIFAFGDVFDSLGIPRLVETLQREGEESFRDLAGSIFAFSCVLALFLCSTLLAISPWTPWIAPGFTAEKKGFVLTNLLYLSPLALIYLPYHAIGSFLRARRRFHSFYIGELVVAVVSFTVILFGHRIPNIIPVSFSIGYLLAFLYVLFAGRGMFRWKVLPQGEKIRGIVRMLFHLLPLYAMNYLFVLVDKTFASFLPTGAVSALSYGILIVVIPTSILMIENVFITPLAEAAEGREAIMRSITTGVLLISVPAAIFLFAYADGIVMAAFERGVFTSGSTRMTADALAYYAIALPAIFIGPVCTRLFQIFGKMGKVAFIVFLAVILNGVLNALFLSMGMGIKGVALASTIAWYGALGAYLQEMRKFGIHLLDRATAILLVFSLLIGACALASSFLVPGTVDGVWGVIIRGIVFLLVTLTLIYFAPNSRIREWREIMSREIVALMT